MDTIYDDRPRSRFPLWLIVLGFCCGAIAYFWAYADHVTATVVAAVTIAGFSGYRLGAAKVCGVFGGLTLAFMFAPTLGRQLEPQFIKWFGTEGFANRMLSTGVAGLGITLIVALTVRLLARWVLEERPLLQSCNKWGGFSFGVVQGAVVMLLLLGGLLVIEPMVENRLHSHVPSGDSKMQKIVARRVIELTSQTRRSAVAPWVVAYNPFIRVRQLKRLHRSMLVLSDPQQLNQLVESNELAQLQQDPSILQAIDELREDPQVRSFFESGKPVDHQAALSFLDNPSIMKLLNQPELLNQLSDLLGETDLESDPPAQSQP